MANISGLFLQLVSLLTVTKIYCEYGSFTTITVEEINEENIYAQFKGTTLTSCVLRCQRSPDCDRVAYKYESTTEDFITCYLIENGATDSNSNMITMHVVTPVLSTRNDVNVSSVKATDQDTETSTCTEDSAYVVTFTQRSIDVPVVTKTLRYVDFITVTAWIKVDKLPDTQLTCPFVVSFLPPSSSYCNDVSVAMSAFSSGLLGYTYPAETVNLESKNSLHEWVHVAILYDGTRNIQDYFINGTKTKRMIWSGIKTRTLDQIRVVIGNDADRSNDICVIDAANQGLLGSVAHLYVWKRLLSLDEITAAYTNEPNTTDAIVLWQEFRSKVNNATSIIEPFPLC
ncbi:uncharacterized protein LOC130621973 [Hydractinia symbiolongicarpus]|uniref:uncharacterized protein LOC130621973 n=1 Tax=Hydractinia symbiolongicarpus TaxID=13093 RepID=UPI00254DDC23|nr:uncharacterized protein LOC130621973 [Hydractinia symbiolongicarpus]